MESWKLYGLTTALSLRLDSSLLGTVNLPSLSPIRMSLSLSLSPFKVVCSHLPASHTYMFDRIYTHP
jgi:hypothetical protein